MGNSLKKKPVKQRRQSIRLKRYDDAQAGAYFLTICVRNRSCLFGEISNGEIKLNDAGRPVQAAWNELPKQFAKLKIDECIVMPHHIRARSIEGALRSSFYMCAISRRATKKSSSPVGCLDGCGASIVRNNPTLSYDPWTNKSGLRGTEG